jgi:hypothetical protein
MGLNDLTLEKLISEINGYKEKMRAIHEDYGHASQDLQDRINVLGYTLNEHLKETRDQIASTPQRLLNLEIKYVTGEVTDAEYRSQRAEFQALLQRNLHSIEEIRQMIDVLSHIETKPLSPAEFKQNYSNRPGLEDWTKNLQQAATSTPPVSTGTASQPLSSPTVTPSLKPSSLLDPIPPERIEPISTASETLVTPVESSNPTPTSPVPAETNGTSFPNPETNNASTSATVAETPVVTVPVETNITTPSIAVTTDVPVSAPLTMDNMLGDTNGSAPLEVAEDVADALVVKVVDDVPTLEASTTVLTPDTSQASTVIPGTEGATTVIPDIQAPTAGDIAKPEIATPNQFYKVVCPKCGADVPKPAKVWELKGGKSKKNVLIGLFQCQDCRVKFREALTREIL